MTVPHLSGSHSYRVKCWILMLPNRTPQDQCSGTEFRNHISWNIRSCILWSLWGIFAGQCTVSDTVRALSVLLHSWSVFGDPTNDWQPRIYTCTLGPDPFFEGRMMITSQWRKSCQCCTNICTHVMFSSHFKAASVLTHFRVSCYFNFPIGWLWIYVLLVLIWFVEIIIWKHQFLSPSPLSFPWLYAMIPRTRVLTRR